MTAFLRPPFAAAMALALSASLAPGLAAADAPRKPARVEGVVTYDGPLPPAVPVIEAQARRHLVERDAKTNGLKDAVVWVEGAEAPKDRPAKKPAYMDQQNYFFVPHVLTLESGQEVEFANSDGANHCVRTTNREPRNCINIVLAPGTSLKHRFVAAKEPVKVDCPVHATMGAWLFVFDHPYYAVTDARGAFKLPTPPPGKYVLHVRHASGGMRRSLPLVVKEGEPQSLKVAFGKDDLKPVQ
jgi:plastocyanin